MNHSSSVSSRLPFVSFATVVLVGLAGCPSGSTTDTSGGDGGRDAQSADTGSPPADATPGTDASRMPTPPPDFAWYVLDETQGTTAHDSTPNHYDMTNLAGVTWNEGAHFDGMAGGGSADVAPSIRVAPITMSAWLTPEARADSTDHGGNALVPFPANAFSTDIPVNGGYAIGINVWTDGTPGSALAVEDVDSCAYPAPNPSLCAANASQNAADMTSGPSCTSASHCDQGFVAGVEYFVVVAVAPADGGAMQPAQVYVNGALFDQTAASTLPPAAQATPLYLGMCNTALSAYGTRAVFDGRIRDARIYSRQLGADEVHQMYVNGPTLHAP
jgi:Concanavalin A-like lectin/glucanases superfamily